jgi:alpha-galactosidase
MRRLPTRPLLALACFLLLAAPASAAVVAQVDDAIIAHDTAAGTWTLTAGGATLTLALDPSRDFALVSLISPSGKPWTTAAVADSFVRVANHALPFGSRAEGFSYQNVTVDTAARRLQLNASFTLASAGLRLTRHYAIVPGSPSFETWTSYTATTAVALSDLSTIELSVPAGAIRWLTGLQGDAAGVPHDTAFTLQQTTLAVGQQFSIGAQYRASEQAVPWFAIDGAKDEFYAALMWSGAWSLAFNRTSAALAFTFGLAPMSTLAQGTIEGPHAVFGVAAGGLTEATAALRAYVVDGLRGGRPLVPLVTYNTWFAYGTEIDEPSMRAEMDSAAALGTELFVVDAGWYAGAGAAGPFDFDAGLGAWTPDPARFPNGLKPLTDYAHSLGLQFGIWVEPERVNLSLVGDPGVEEDWLATTGGAYGSDHAGQICLASAAARQWLMDRITGFIDEVQPDYLKWDNNMFINCDRSGHGHGATDGNFAHVTGLYDMLSALRERYPSLLIENVSGGGNRLDVGMMRYTDVGWMDDRTAPSVNVRHNLQGLSAVFPPSYLLSFVTDHDTEPLHDAPDLSLYFRSRMAGALGLCFRSESFEEGDAASISHEIDIYKAIRGTLSVSAAALLTKQAEVADGPAWDVLQEGTSSSDALVVSAFQSDAGVPTFNVKPTGLQAGTTYQVQSVDTGLLGTATGAALMSGGIDLLQSPTSAAHILIITVRQQQ